jgi:hypothetical protein
MIDKYATILKGSPQFEIFDAKEKIDKTHKELNKKSSKKKVVKKPLSQNRRFPVIKRD